ncbi:hypothetical protein B7988_03125 [Fibrobacter sp. UWB1]|jgi:transcriptional regulator with XRE-family HTH domain|uniref:helix-turn-helix domain-containing protein n=1 Tax=Fibrobacter sp. UWB1 TaxID=1964355 RepID=UPI000B5221D2|nr:helix-turn-helix transcriptional regulator [Fibrobacter sp. UWB1]OWV27161.1 hypothetical protein B7988_03125 [Fibrobacter sp. UWB1]
MNVEKYLDRTNKTASTLADELGLNASSVTAWKKGKATPSYDICQKLLEIGMGIDELFTPELWEAIKTRHAAEFRGEVVLTPEECALIVRNGLRSLRLKDENSEDQQG